MPRPTPDSIQDYMRNYPRITAHIICESLGYATPSCAARILKDAQESRENWCEWVYSCYGRDPKIPVRNAIRNRHTHHGYMAEYRPARALVQRAIEGGEEPVFASCF